MSSPKPSAQAANNGDSNNPTNTSHSTSDLETYTAEDNKTLLAMKADQKSWKQILEALNKKSKSQLMAHYKEISAATKPDADKKDGTSSGDASAKAKQDGNKGKGQNAANTGAEKGKAAKGGKNTNTNATTTTNNNNQKKGNEAQTAAVPKAHLRKFVAKYERDKWLAAASRHYDFTGQRISPEAAKRLWEEEASREA